MRVSRSLAGSRRTYLDAVPSSVPFAVEQKAKVKLSGCECSAHIMRLYNSLRMQEDSVLTLRD